MRIENSGFQLGKKVLEAAAEQSVKSGGEARSVPRTRPPEGGRADIAGLLDLNFDNSAIEQALFQGRKISTAELLLYQVRMGRFGLGVELVSRLAEGLLAALRRLQNNQ